MADPHQRVLDTVEDTEAFGRELAATLRPGDLVVLDGPLGAGKTALTRGIAAGLGVAGRVSSPTFIIARAHKAGVRPDGTPGVAMVHVDAYRLAGDLDELDSLDLDTDLHHAVVVVEWGKGWSNTSPTGTCESNSPGSRNPMCARRSGNGSNNARSRAHRCAPSADTTRYC